MARDSKILTVSYGAFSCTLEGFEDPFAAMKAVAEYFRDLAADDREFGVLSKSLDPDFMDRLAAQDAASGPFSGNPAQDVAMDSALAVDAADGSDNSDMFVAADAEPDLAPNEVPEDTDAAESTAKPEQREDVAARLVRLRKMLSVPTETTEQSEVFTEAAEFETAEEIAEQPKETPDSTDSEALLDRLGSLLDDPDASEAQIADVHDEVSEIQPSDDSGLSEAIAEAASFYADQPEESAGDEDTVAEVDVQRVDEAHAKPEDGQAAGAWSDAPALQPAGFAGWNDAAIEPEPVEDVEEEAPKPIASDDASSDTIPPELAGSANDLDQEIDQTDGSDEPLEPQSREDLAAANAALQAALRDDPLPEAIAEAAPEDADLVRPQPGNKTARTKRVTSRIVRIHPDGDEDVPPPATSDHAISHAEANDEEVARLMRQADDEMSDEANRRRLEALAHAKAAVAATEAERATTGDIAKVSDQKLDRYRDDLAQVVQPDAGAGPKGDVAAAQPDPIIDPATGSIRPGAFAPPPLVLVSEQRIDRLPHASSTPAAPAATQAPAPQPAATPRTGRLTGMIGVGAAATITVSPDAKLVLPKPSHGAPVDTDDEDDFEEDLTDLDEAGLAGFARRLGVSSMAEMLEAAAAYATCIEKRSQFTRPQLMRRLVASAGGRPVSREDGLRSFGMLLRTGRIEKVGRGFYRLSDTSPYLAEARRHA